MDAMALVIPLAIDVPTYVPTHNTNTSIPLNMTINTCIYSVETMFILVYLGAYMYITTIVKLLYG